MYFYLHDKNIQRKNYTYHKKYKNIIKINYCYSSADVATGKCISRIFIPESEWSISRLNSCRLPLSHSHISFAGKYFSILQPRKGVNMYAYSILCLSRKKRPPIVPIHTSVTKYKAYFEETVKRIYLNNFLYNFLSLIWCT